MSTQLDDKTDEKLKTGDASCAHIVRGEPGKPAQETVITARINGTPVEALCGYIFVPQNNPKSKPLCPICKDLYEMNKDFGDAPRGFNPGDLPG